MATRTSNEDLARSSSSSTAENTPLGDYVIGHKIGQGSFATVYVAHLKNDRSQQAAVKSVVRSKLTNRLVQNLESEISILKSIHHDHIVGLMDCIKTETHIHLIMEYCSMGDLSAYIKRKRNGSTTRMFPYGLPEVIGRHFLKQLASALEFLRSQNLIHRDIKPQNLLLAPYLGRPNNDKFVGLMELPTLKIADFGFARFLPSQSLAETLCGSPLYMAPEILRYEKYDAKADLWSVGAVLYEIVTGKPPFRAQNYVELLKKIERGGDRIKFPGETSGESVSGHTQVFSADDLSDVFVGSLASGMTSTQVISDELKNFIRRLLKRNPVERISFGEFFSHPAIVRDITVARDEARAISAGTELTSDHSQPRQSQRLSPALDRRPSDGGQRRQEGGQVGNAHMQQMGYQQPRRERLPINAYPQHPRNDIYEIPPFANINSPNTLLRSPMHEQADLLSGNERRHSHPRRPHSEDQGLAYLIPQPHGVERRFSGGDRLDSRGMIVHQRYGQSSPSPPTHMRGRSGQHLADQAMIRSPTEPGAQYAQQHHPISPHQRSSHHSNTPQNQYGTSYPTEATLSSRRPTIRPLRSNSYDVSSPPGSLLIQGARSKDKDSVESEKSRSRQAEEDVLFEREYVVVEKRAVEVNELADGKCCISEYIGKYHNANQFPEVASSPKIQTLARRPQQNLPHHTAPSSLPTTSNSPMTPTSYAPSPSPTSLVSFQNSPLHALPTAGTSYSPGPTLGDPKTLSHRPSTGSALTKAISMASMRLFGTGNSPPRLNDRGSALPSPTAGTLDRRPSLLGGVGSLVVFDGAPTGDAEEESVLKLIEDAACKAYAVAHFADDKFYTLIPAPPNADPFMAEERPGKDGDALSTRYGPSFPSSPDPNLAEETLVLYLKALALLQTGLDAAKDYWSKVSRGYVSSRGASPRLNAAVQWMRDRFNECLERAEYAKSKCPNDNDEGNWDICMEKLLYDHALEMSRNAAVNELVGEDLAGCEKAYQIAIWMLEAILDTRSQSEEEAMDDEDRRVVQKFVTSITNRLNALRKKLDGYRGPAE
ncbi:hypothetical protein BZG36_04253 [Bifiguratus adelaidae]|uniref:non-specific serine/threonine protein kinase n=1 Tax=Bifiguratus adelaidae TaxID=1938954 RepID=A0A261XVY8_9FUNG|nr:hypothetical protein BZG36_04253 [Bifiguratus adelaidae]